ncbi:MAG: methylmalonyl-CoA epimerase [Maricaulaceae bacterium]
MKLGPMNHVGIAVPDLETAVARYRDIFNATDISDVITMEDRGLYVQFVNLPTGQVELIAPMHDKTAIAKFLEKNPQGGQHHICFEVADIHAAVADMCAKNIRVLGDPRVGAHGTPVIFLHPKDMGGVLIELMETPAEMH